MPAKRKSTKKPLGLKELIAIAVGGMIGGGIFTILGISVSMVGIWAPLAIAMGGSVAALAAYSYVQLGKYFMDEGATYSFFKRSFPNAHMAAAAVGWWTIFGYISTLSLYAYTFSSYALSVTDWAGNEWARKIVSWGVIWVFALINVWSVRGMGHIEDVMVYVKVVILLTIAGLLMMHPDAPLPVLMKDSPPLSVIALLTVASLTFVAYEGFQLVINAVKEMEDPKRNMPRAIYTAMVLVTLIYVLVALASVLAVPFKDIIDNKEYALAAAAKAVLGPWGGRFVVLGAVLATMSAISGTLFGSSRQMAKIADDRYFPAFIDKRWGMVPVHAILTMATTASLLILIGGLRMILEFGSVTFLVVSFLMALANYRLRAKTESHVVLTWLAMIGLATGTGVVFWYEAHTSPAQITFIAGIYVVLTLGAILYARAERRRQHGHVHVHGQKQEREQGPHSSS